MDAILLAHDGETILSQFNGIECDSIELPDPLITGKIEEELYAYNPRGHSGVVLLTGDARKVVENIKYGTTIQSLKSLSIDDNKLSTIIQSLANKEIVSLGNTYDIYLKNKRIGTKKQVKRFFTWLQITDKCNLNCHYCYINKKSSSLSIIDAKKIVAEIIKDATQLNYNCVVFKLAGGEPTIEWATCKELIEWTYNNFKDDIDIRFSILTNGTSIPNGFIEIVQKFNIGISISIDGYETQHDKSRSYLNGKGSFTDITNNIDHLSVNGISPFILTTVTTGNVFKLRELSEFCFQKNLKFRFSLQRDNNPELAHKQNQIYIDGLTECYDWMQSNLPPQSLYSCHKFGFSDLMKPHSRVCGMGVSNATISSDARLCLCQQYDLNSPISQSNKRNIVNLINKQVKYDQKLIDVDNMDSCRKCIWRYTCGGGCPLHRFHQNQNMGSPSPHCQVYKAILPKFVHLHAAQLLSKYNNYLSKGGDSNGQ